MKSAYVLLFSIGLSSLSVAQEISSKNQFTVSLVNGLNRSSSEKILGDQTPENALGITHGFNFHYSRILSPNFSVSAGAGFGFLPVRVSVAPYNGFEGLSGYFRSLSFIPFSKMEILGSYRKSINEKYAAKFQLGVGFNQFGNGSYGISGAQLDENSNSIELYRFEINTNGGVSPYATIGAGISKTLKNKDELELRLSYDYSFRNAYTGTYALYDQTSQGKYFNRGNFLNLTLAYTLTRNERLNRLNQLKSDPSISKKEAKKKLKKENRYIDPSSSFLYVGGGFGTGMNKVVEDAGGQLMKAGFSSFLPRVAFEKGIKNNFYAEVGLHSQLFWNTSRFKFDQYGSSGSDAFYAYQLSLGGIYRVIAKNNYNIINLHAGLSVGFHTEKNGPDGLNTWGNGSYGGSIDGDTIYFNYASQNRIKSNLISSVYWGLSKDFRVVKNFYFTLNYRQQIGLFKVTETTYNYSGTNVEATTGAKTKITGTSRDFQLGFKVKF